MFSFPLCYFLFVFAPVVRMKGEIMLLSLEFYNP